MLIRLVEEHGAVFHDLGEKGEAIGVADGAERPFGVHGHGGDEDFLRATIGQHARLGTGGAFGAGEVPEGDAAAAIGGQKGAGVIPAKLRNFGGVAAHLEIQPIGEAPEVEGLFLHGRDQPFAIRRIGEAKVGAFPREEAGWIVNVIERQNSAAAIVAGRDARADGRHRETANCGRHFVGQDEGRTIGVNDSDGFAGGGEDLALFGVVGDALEEHVLGGSQQGGFALQGGEVDVAVFVGCHEAIRCVEDGEQRGGADLDSGGFLHADAGEVEEAVSGDGSAGVVDPGQPVDGRVEGMGDVGGGRGHRMVVLADGAGEEIGFQGLFIEVAADEDEGGGAFFFGFPFGSEFAVGHHVHGLEDIAFGLVFDIEDAFGAQHVLAFAGEELAHPVVELLGVDGEVGSERDAGDVVIVVVVVAFGSIVDEVGVYAQNVLQAEGVAGEDVVQCDFLSVFIGKLAVAAVDDGGEGVDGADGGFGVLHFFFKNCVDLIDNNCICEGDLIASFGGFLQLAVDMGGIDHGEDAVEFGGGLHVGIGKEGLGDGGGVGKAGGFQQDGIELIAAAHEGGEDADEVSPHGAADAAVVHFEDLFIDLRGDEFIIDALQAEFVNDDGIFAVGFFGEDTIEKCGFACAEEPGKDGDGGEGSVGGHGKSFRKRISLGVS